MNGPMGFLYGLVALFFGVIGGIVVLFSENNWQSTYTGIGMLIVAAIMAFIWILIFEED